MGIKTHCLFAHISQESSDAMLQVWHGAREHQAFTEFQTDPRADRDPTPERNLRPYTGAVKRTRPSQVFGSELVSAA
jgi:hypothetical protein